MLLSGLTRRPDVERPKCAEEAGDGPSTEENRENKIDSAGKRHQSSQSQSQADQCHEQPANNLSPNSKSPLPLDVHVWSLPLVQKMDDWRCGSSTLWGSHIDLQGSFRTATPVANDGNWRHSAALSEIRGAISERGAALSLHRTQGGSLGIARAAFEFAHDYAQDRKQFGKPIWQHEAIGLKLADMAIKVDAARLLIWRAGWMATQGRAFERAEGSMAKCFAGDVAVEVTTDAIQVLGGYGYIKEYPVEKWFRDAKLYQIWEGTAEIQRLVISRALAGQRSTINLSR